MTVELYVLSDWRDCWSCAAVRDSLTARGVRYTLHPFEPAEAGAVLEKFPQMASSQARGGIRTPFMVVDGLLVGGFHDILYWLGGQKPKEV